MKRLSLVDINYYLYTLLLILTPFLMLQNFLQNAIGTASRATIKIFTWDIPITVIIAIIILLIISYFLRKWFSKKRLIVIGIIIIFFAIGQLTSDYYFGHHFYDLQHNWHYFAYGIFTYIAFRKLSVKQQPLYKIFYKIFLLSLSISLFDEIIQVFISSRVFDLSDVAKDLWGSIIGCIFVFFCMKEGKGIPNYTLRQSTLKKYITNPFSLFCLEVIFAYIFLFVSSQLTNEKYIFSVFFITLTLFVLAFLLIHVGRNKYLRWAVRGVFVIVICIVVYAAYNGSPQTKFVSGGYIKYNGIPLLYFDYMIFPDGAFRIVDKKELFKGRDKQKIENLNPDILLIGTGTKGQGGKGWMDNESSQMVYNRFYNNVYQLIKLPNKKACETYNRLSEEGKKVLFIIYNN